MSLAVSMKHYEQLMDHERGSMAKLVSVMSPSITQTVLSILEAVGVTGSTMNPVDSESFASQAQDLIALVDRHPRSGASLCPTSALLKALSLIFERFACEYKVIMLLRTDS